LGSLATFSEAVVEKLKELGRRAVRNI